MTTSPDYYEVLQVSPNADAEVIQAAYRRLVEKWQATRSVGDPSAFTQLGTLDEALSCLSDPVRRLDYDAQRHQRANVQIEPRETNGPELVQLKSQPEPITNADANRSKNGAVVGRTIAAIVLSLVTYAGLGIVLPLNAGGVFCKMVVTIGIGVALFRWAKAGSSAARSYRAEWIWGILFAIDGGIGLYAATLNSTAPKVQAGDLRLSTQDKPQQTKGVPSSEFLKALDASTKASESYQSGLQLWDKGEYQKASLVFENVIRLDPNHADAHYYLGVECSSALNPRGQDDNKAIWHFGEAIRSNPEFARAYSARSYTWKKQNNVGRSLQDINEAIRLAPNNGYYRSCRGDLWEEIGEYEKAVQDYEAAITLDDKNATTIRTLAWLLATCPKDSIRNGIRAIQLALKARELAAPSNQPKPDFEMLLELETVAAAYAEVGYFLHAIEFQEKALKFAISVGFGSDACRSRLALYQKRQPYRATP